MKTKKSKSNVVIDLVLLFFGCLLLVALFAICVTPKAEVRQNQDGLTKTEFESNSSESVKFFNPHLFIEDSKDHPISLQEVEPLALRYTQIAKNLGSMSFVGPLSQHAIAVDVKGFKPLIVTSAMTEFAKLKRVKQVALYADPDSVHVLFIEGTDMDEAVKEIIAILMGEPIITV